MSASAAASEQPDPARVGGTPDQPVADSERIASFDFIRGIAVLGILFANITAYGHPMVAYFWPGALPGGGTAADGWVWLFQFVFVDGKFRGLFTLLFGAGLYLFMERAWARGRTRALQVRRLLWLMLFGVAHFYLLFVGDILFLYSVSGFAVLLMLRWQARTQLTIGLVWYLLGALAFTAALGTQAAIEAVPEAREQAGEAWPRMQAQWRQQIADGAAEAQVVREGSYRDVVAYRFTEQSEQLAIYAAIAVFETIPLMLMGMALYRFGFFAATIDRGRMRRWGWNGFLGGAAISLALGGWAVDRGFPPFLTQLLFNGLSGFPRIAMVIGLAALLVLWTARAAPTALGGRVAAAGRMAFSNYIGTSLVMMLVFHGWAGGFYGELNRTALLAFVLLGWTLMLAWSKPWLDRFSYGPLEWLWRCLTYGRLFPLRR